MLLGYKDPKISFAFIGISASSITLELEGIEGDVILLNALPFGIINGVV